MYAIYSILLIFELAVAIPIFILLSFIKAPYGKFTSSGWGPKIKAPLGWFLMELPSVILPIWFFAVSGRTDQALFWIYICIWELHYIQRTFIYPGLMNKSSHKMPLLILLFSAVFNLINGSVNGFGIFILKETNSESILSINLIVGILIFIAGFILNLHSDAILRRLRRPGENGYKIPNKGMFRYICSPNYLGEIIEWLGWAVLTWSPAGAAFLVFTIANLAPRAAANLKWYKKTFPEYPENRKALIPFIF